MNSSSFRSRVSYPLISVAPGLNENAAHGFRRVVHQNAALFVKVTPEMYSVNYLRQGKYPDVKFPLWRIIPMWAAYQQRIVNILLDDPFLVGPRILKHFLYLHEVLEHDDAFPTICVFTRLAYPDGLFVILEAI